MKRKLVRFRHARTVPCSSAVPTEGGLVSRHQRKAVPARSSAQALHGAGSPVTPSLDVRKRQGPPAQRRRAAVALLAAVAASGKSHAVCNCRRAHGVS